MALDKSLVFFLAGGVVCFGIGLFDDLKGSRAMVKLLFQVAGGLLAFLGGIEISQFEMGGFIIEFGLLTAPVTIFWFVLFMNAVNLVDGLDGLAGGIVSSAGITMVILSYLNNDMFTAVLFTALAGSVLGFLRYNFNPATIFMGDSGSYFLGYAIAGISIIGSVKSHVAPALLIPLLAMGVPIFDTILSPVRRFVRGRRIFQPDSSHIHHRLKNMGFSTVRAVSTLYGITVFLCAAALITVNLRDIRAGLIIIAIAAGAIFMVRRLGYFEYLSSERFRTWLRCLGDESGISLERRRFFDHQIEISRAGDINEMWHRLTDAAEFLGIDFLELRFTTPAQNQPWPPVRRYENPGTGKSFEDNSLVIHLRLPLANNGDRYGYLKILQNAGKREMPLFLLRRLEQLRWTVTNKLADLDAHQKVLLNSGDTILNSCELSIVSPELLSPELYELQNCEELWNENGKNK
nr:MraY family glycosyltransferase [Desulfosalsimonas propionicica]